MWLGCNGSCGCLNVSAGVCAASARMRLFRWLLKQPVPKQIERYSRFSPSPLSIKQFLDFGECGAVGPRGRYGLHSPGTRGRCLPGPPPPRVSVARGKVRGNRRRGSRMPGDSPGDSNFGERRGQGLAPAHRPGLYLETRKPRPRTLIRAARPRPASVASNLLDTDLTVLKT